MKFKRKIEIEKRLDITPLIDVVLLLIIFFMLSSSFIMQPGIKIKLPAATSSKPQEKTNLIISISKEGFIFINDERITLDGLQNKLKASADTDINVIIRADTNVRHGNVVEVMNIATVSGVKKIAIATKPLEQEP